MKRSYIYLSIVLAIYALFVIVFTTFPRSTFSPLEKRELATFPVPTLDNIKSGEFTSKISEWFSDSEPYRDSFMAMSMIFGDNMKLRLFNNAQSNIKFHAATKGATPDEMGATNMDDVEQFTNTVNADDSYKKARRGIIITGEGNNVRALSAYGGGPEGGVKFAEACNEYNRVFGNQAKVYCLVVPTAIEYYCPDAAKSVTKPQLPTIKAINERLDEGVIPINAYSALAKHVNEPIYSRTDHHWSPLGAYYTAQEFARVAKVPFRDLSNYDKKVVHGFVGSMYGYSHDIALKNAPEDFIYYVPRGVQYTTTYINYKLSKNFGVVGEQPETQGEFFYTYPDGSNGAYCTFMGGDTKLTHVNTSTKNGRRLLIIKDSYGNALPGYLFFSFEDIHVVDFRYFSKNMKKYIEQNHITDILIQQGIFRAYSGGEGIKNFITQPDGTYSHKSKNSDSSKDNKDSKRNKQKSKK